MPDPSRHRSDAEILGGDLPPLSAAPADCAFHPRCAFAVERCRAERPALEPLRDGQEAACLRPLGADGRPADVPAGEEARR